MIADIAFGRKNPIAVAAKVAWVAERVETIRVAGNAVGEPAGGAHVLDSEVICVAAAAAGAGVGVEAGEAAATAKEADRTEQIVAWKALLNCGEGASGGPSGRRLQVEMDCAK